MLNIPEHILTVLTYIDYIDVTLEPLRESVFLSRWNQTQDVGINYRWRDWFTFILKEELAQLERTEAVTMGTTVKTTTTNDKLEEDVT